MSDTPRESWARAVNTVGRIIQATTGMERDDAHNAADAAMEDVSDAIAHRFGLTSPETPIPQQEPEGDGWDASRRARVTPEETQEAVDRLRARVQPRRVSDWRPMETAPKDGTVIRLHSPYLMDEDFNPSGSCEAFWQQDFGWMGSAWNPVHDTWDAIEIRHATHWMSLPAPPITPTGGEGGS